MVQWSCTTNTQKFPLHVCRNRCSTKFQTINTWYGCRICVCYLTIVYCSAHWCFLIWLLPLNSESTIHKTTIQRFETIRMELLKQKYILVSPLVNMVHLDQQWIISLLSKVEWYEKYSSTFHQHTITRVTIVYPFENTYLMKASSRSTWPVIQHVNNTFRINRSFEAFWLTSSPNILTSLISDEEESEQNKSK